MDMETFPKTRQDAIVEGEKIARSLKPYMDSLPSHDAREIAAKYIVDGLQWALRRAVERDYDESCPMCKGGSNASDTCELCWGFREVSKPVKDAYERGWRGEVWKAKGDTTHAFVGYEATCGKCYEYTEHSNHTEE